LDHLTFSSYLASKRNIDDRALNLRVWERLKTSLPPQNNAPLQVLELGAGIGTMFERMADWGLLFHAEYTALDQNPENVKSGRSSIRDWAKNNSIPDPMISQSETRPVHQKKWLQLNYQEADVFDFLNQAAMNRTFDLIVAHAFMDLVDQETLLRALLAHCKPGSLFYFTLTFDGATFFDPVLDPHLDQLIETLYHRSMDLRTIDGKPSGSSRAGRKLLQNLSAFNLEILEAGSSDWVVYPREGKYPENEKQFLHFIIDTVEKELRDHPELASHAFTDWVRARHQQIEHGELIYQAHQLDVLARVVLSGL
jgi:SAM-dependent methyltransferase